MTRSVKIHELEVCMTFLNSLLETLFKLAVIVAVSYGGIQLGRYLRKKKDEKDDK